MCQSIQYIYIHTYMTVCIQCIYINMCTHHIHTYIHTLHYITLHYITLPYLTLPYHTIPYHTYIHTYILSLSLSITYIYIYIHVYMRVFFACNMGRATEYVDLPEFNNGPILASKTNWKEEPRPRNGGHLLKQARLWLWPGLNDHWNRPELTSTTDNPKAQSRLSTTRDTPYNILVTKGLSSSCNVSEH